MITPCIKQLQYLKKFLASWNGNQFRQIAKGIPINYFKIVSTGINSGLKVFSLNKNHPIFGVESCRVAKFGINYYKTVGSSNNTVHKRSKT